MKTTLYAEDVVAAYATRTLRGRSSGPPTAWRNSCPRRTAATLPARRTLALDEDGRILALRVHSHANLGAYATPAGVVIQLMIGPWVSTSVYDIHTIDVHIDGVLTNTTPTGPYRGAGRPEAIYTIERLIDAAARKIGHRSASSCAAATWCGRCRCRTGTRWARPTTPASSSACSITAWRSPTGTASRCAHADSRTARPPARPRHRDVRRVDRRRGVRASTVTVTVSDDGIEIFSRDAADGHVARDHVRAARRRRVRRAAGQDPHRVRRHRPRHGLRQRGLALAVRRRLRGARGVGAHGEEGARARGGGARGGRRRHRVPRRRVPHRAAPIARSGSSTSPASSPSGASCSTRPTRWPTRRGPTDATCARSRSIRTPARSRSPNYWSVNDVGRVVNPMVVVGPARRRRRAGHRPGAVRAGRLRPRIRTAAHRHVHRLRAAAREHDPPLRDDDGRVHAVDEQPPRREGRGRARHHRRDADGGQRGRRRARAKRPRQQASTRCRCRSRPRRSGGRSPADALREHGHVDLDAAADRFRMDAADEGRARRRPCARARRRSSRMLAAARSRRRIALCRELGTAAPAMLAVQRAEASAAKAVVRKKVGTCQRRDR